MGEILSKFKLKRAKISFSSTNGVQMSAFLYVCSVQGIQDFIFQSNVLKEIIGASELVKCVENLAQSDDKIALQKGIWA